MMQRRALRQIQLLFLGLLVVLGLHFFGWLAPVGSFFRAAAILPVRYLLTITASEKVPVGAPESKEIAILESKLRTLELENGDLRQQLDFKKKNPWQTIGAEIISHDIDAGSQVIIINRGLRDGVAEGQPVIAEDGILVGKIIKVSNDVAWVRLLVDSQSAVGAEVLNDEKSSGVMSGGYGLSLRMQFIPRNETIVVGQSVVTSGLEPQVPAGILIGSIAAVENEAYQPFQQAILTPAVHFSRLRLVSIITSK